ncbi:Gfo/Idh/MocA family protein [Microcella sp.]|uniref:Gfo/Idh/MocA family protein n=1 Tax=Microcella sp. TaxID=1913979 RepID=UPI003F714C51
MNPKVARVAVLGAGGISAGAHLPAIAGLADRVELVGIVEPDPERRARAAETYPTARVYADAADMLKEESPDLVHVATPPHTHEKLAIQVLEAGSWAYCEKPLAGSLAAVDRIIEAERATGQWCVTVSQFRYAGGSQEIREGLSTERWGRPLVGTARTVWYRHPSYWDIPWRGKRETEFAGATTSQAIHAIDLLMWLMGGDWDVVGSFVDTLSRPIEVEDASVAIVRMKSGALANLVSTVLSHDQRTMVEVLAEGAALELNTVYYPRVEEWTVTTMGSDGVQAVHDDWTPPQEYVAPHQAQLSSILDHWSRGVKPELTAADARNTIELLTALYKSATTGQFVQRGTIVPGDAFYDALDAGADQRVTTR